MTAATGLSPDREMLAQFVDLMFKNAKRDGVVSLRAFPDKTSGQKREKAIFVEPIRLSDPDFFEVAIERARQAATWDDPAVFAPPVALFKNHQNAKTENISEGPCLSVECDQNPQAARSKLEALLGVATGTIASGGEWTNPQTGETEPKLHLYWRLKKPSATKAEHALLREARELATRLVDGDATNIAVVHPMRWPGSWHRKGTPKLAQIVASSDNEIDLDEAVELLREASGLRECSGAGVKVSGRLMADDPAAVAAALAAIPNDPGTDWDFWNGIGMKTSAATGHSEFGRDQFHKYSARSPKYNRNETDARWDNYKTSPPTKAGFGSLVYLAREHSPEWTWPKSGAGTRAQAVIRAVQDIDNGAITQDGIAQVFARRFENRLRFCHHTGAWFEWTGKYWKRDETARAFQFCRELGREFTADSKASELKEVRKISFAGGVEKFAKSDQLTAVTSEVWDRDPFLIGTPDGTVDLRTGEIRAPDALDGITKITAVAPADIADCPRWRQFLQETFGDDELIRFIQQWCGYSLTGDISEHALLFGSGNGGNGKGTWLDTVSGIMGDYAVTAAMETFTASKFDRHPTELAMLRGARMVTASETEEGRAWAESRIKQLTGGDPITARFMHRDFFTFQPQFKLTIIGNHQPTLSNVDDAIRRRFNLVPFDRKPATPDLQLKKKLKAEWPGILRWMIVGCLDWQKAGLTRPESITRATENYFKVQDSIGQWLAEDCDAEPGNLYKCESISALFASWTAFASRSGEKPGTMKSFSPAMVKRGFKRDEVGHSKTIVLRGVRLLPEDDED